MIKLRERHLYFFMPVTGKILPQDGDVVTLDVLVRNPDARLLK